MAGRAVDKSVDSAGQKAGRTPVVAALEAEGFHPVPFELRDRAIDLEITQIERRVRHQHQRIARLVADQRPHVRPVHLHAVAVLAIAHQRELHPAVAVGHQRHRHRSVFRKRPLEKIRPLNTENAREPPKESVRARDRILALGERRPVHARHAFALAIEPRQRMRASEILRHAQVHRGRALFIHRGKSLPWLESDRRSRRRRKRCRCPSAQHPCIHFRTPRGRVVTRKPGFGAIEQITTTIS